MGDVTASTPQPGPQARVWMARWVVPVDKPPLAHGFVQTDENGLIQGVGRVSDLPMEQQADYNPDNTLLITPGLINTHTHLELTYDRPILAEAGMGPWLQAVIALSRQDTPDKQARRIVSGIGQLLGSGTTFIHDISRTGASIPWMQQAGLGGQVALEFFHPFDTDPDWSALDIHWEGVNRSIQGDASIQPGLSPHSLYNVSPRAWKQAIQRFKPAFIHTHLAESLDEQAWWRGADNTALHTLHRQVLGKTVPCLHPSQRVSDYLAAAGLLDYPARFAHGVFCDEQDIDRLARWGWQVLHCPRSNLHLSRQTLTSSQWPNRLPLGTDSTLSCSDLDMRAEARVAADCHGWTAERALRAATLDGAKALDVTHSRGSLSIGKRAELALWSFNRAEGQQSPESLWLSVDTSLACVWTPDMTNNIIQAHQTL